LPIKLGGEESHSRIGTEVRLGVAMVPVRQTRLRDLINKTHIPLTWTFCASCVAQMFDRFSREGNEMVRGILLAGAKQEARRLSERVICRHSQGRRQGHQERHPIGRPRVGEKRLLADSDPAPQLLELCGAQAPIGPRAAGVVESGPADELGEIGFPAAPTAPWAHEPRYLSLVDQNLEALSLPTASAVLPQQSRALHGAQASQLKSWRARQDSNL
jgi:hypothetical protein